MNLPERAKRVAVLANEHADYGDKQGRLAQPVVDALHAELKPRLDTLPPRDVHGPADKPYGQRELLVLAPDGDLIAFGQPIRRPGAADPPG